MLANNGARHAIKTGFMLGKLEDAEIAFRVACRLDPGCAQACAGLAMVAVIVSIFFAGISGSGPADTAALGAILIPGMVKAGYDRKSAAALMAAGGGIGIIIPPSIALVIYGVVANASVSRLFIAGILPGVVVGLSLFAVSYLLFGRDPNIRPEARGSRYSIQEQGKPLNRHDISARGDPEHTVRRGSIDKCRVFNS